MNRIKLKTAKRKTTVSRTAVRKVVSGVFVKHAAVTTPKKEGLAFTSAPAVKID
jgi:hypothetical protein